MKASWKKVESLWCDQKLVLIANWQQREFHVFCFILSEFHCSYLLVYFSLYAKYVTRAKNSFYWKLLGSWFGNCVYKNKTSLWKLHRYLLKQTTNIFIVQRDATQGSLFIVLRVHSTCFGCQPHPASGVHKTVTTASGIGQLPPCNVAKLAWPRCRKGAAQKHD